MNTIRKCAGFSYQPKLHKGLASEHALEAYGCNRKSCSPFCFQHKHQKEHVPNTLLDALGASSEDKDYEHNRDQIVRYLFRLGCTDQSLVKRQRLADDAPPVEQAAVEPAIAPAVEPAAVQPAAVEDIVAVAADDGLLLMQAALGFAQEASKCCPRCKIVKSLDDFFYSPISKDNKRSRCKKCDTEATWVSRQKRLVGIRANKQQLPSALPTCT